MKIGTAQINFKIGDLTGNAQQIIDTAQQLNQEGCDLIVFPEMAMTGYYPWDLLDQPGFVDLQLQELERVAQQTAHLHADLLVGCVTYSDHPGKRYYNSFVQMSQGRIVHTGHKQLLPTYNIFDERRHFEAGAQTSILQIGDYRFAVLICEDAWNAHNTDYTVNPLQDAQQHQVDAIITLNASPWQTGKHWTRLDLFKETSAQYQLPLLYVNQVGGHDEIIYDGSSFATTAQGQVSWKAPFAQSHLQILNFESGEFKGPSADWPLETPAQQLAMIELGLRDYLRKCNFKSVVVGSSGGIDSAVTLALAERVLGSEHVHAITMPSRYSSSGSVSDSQTLCDRLNISLMTLPIKNTFDQQMADYQNTFQRQPARLAIENMQARLRGLALMTYSNDTGALLLTTGNKSEVSVGYCTLYGDMNGGLNLIGDLYKTEVYTLARYINQIDPRQPIPVEIIDKAPSAELFEDQKDSDSLPPYEELDAILRLYIERDLLSAAEISQAQATLVHCNTSDALKEKIMQMVDRAEFKRWQSCPILRMHARAFGTGRRYPIAQGFKPQAALLNQIHHSIPQAKH